MWEDRDIYLAVVYQQPTLVSLSPLTVVLIGLFLHHGCSLDDNASVGQGGWVSAGTGLALTGARKQLPGGDSKDSLQRRHL